MIDASALVELLLRTIKGERVERAVGAADLAAPDLVNAEVMQGLRGLERGGKLTAARAGRAIARLSESSIWQVPTGTLVREAWSMRANFSAYDACYLALARALGCPLLTTDRRLTRAPEVGVTLICI